MTTFVKQRELVCTLQIPVRDYFGDNKFVGDDPKGWPYGVIDRHNQLEEVVRSCHRDETLIGVVHRCALDPIDSLYYCERELSFALASREGEDPADCPPVGSVAGDSAEQPPGSQGVAGFNHSLHRLLTGAAP